MHVAFLGLGAMGSRMAQNLLKAGHSLTVWNRTPSAAEGLVAHGAQLASSPRSAAHDADAIISMLRDDDASRTVWLDPIDGALFGMKEHAIAIESSTVSFQWARSLAQRIHSAERDFLDAPVLGSRPQAENAQLIHVVGGEPRILDRARPILSAVGVEIHHMGASGSGAAMKLIVNAMLGIQVAALGELLASARRMELDEKLTARVLGQTPVCGPAAKVAAAGMAAGMHAPAFPVDLIEKDLGYLISEAGIVPMSAAACSVFQHAIASGYGTKNMTAAALLY